MIEAYIGKSISCDCGKIHNSKVETIVIREGVIEQELAAYLQSKAVKRITVVCDNNTYGVAGHRVCKMLDSIGISYKLHKFLEEAVLPNAHFIGNLALGMDLSSDMLLAVGSGTINDITRYVSAVADKPYCVVGTAPSMDGYNSGGSALIHNNMKLNFETRPPKAVFLDPAILATAPLNMIASGVGDLLGKINCLTDWQLSKIVTGEWHCSFISGIVEAAIQKVSANPKGLAKKETSAMADLVEGLLLSGVCMDFAENSRPASGAEHHMSHFLEMRFLLEGREAVFHGTKVGIGTGIALRAYAFLAALKPDFEKIKKLPRASFESWEQNIQASFLEAAPQLVELEKKCGKNSPEKLQKRLAATEANWDAIRALAENTVKAAVVRDILQEVEGPTKLPQIGVDKELARQTILYAKELRDRYTVLQLLWDLGELENFADTILEQDF